MNETELRSTACIDMLQFNLV